jgi:hypothetical protein
MKKFSFIFVGFYICPEGKDIIEVRFAESIPSQEEIRLEVVSDIEGSTLLEIMSPREVVEKYKGYSYLKESYNYFFKKDIKGWIY